MLFQTVVTAAEGLTFTDTIPFDTLLTFLLGFGIVFIGLIFLIFIVKLLGLCVRMATKKKATSEPSPVVEEQPAENRGELVAAVSAALATVMGKQVSGIRILSMKKVD